MPRKKAARKTPATIPDFLKERVDSVLETATRFEKEAEKVVKELKTKGDKQIKDVKPLQDLTKRSKKIRTDVEKIAEDGLKKAMVRLNVPTKKELTRLIKKVEELRQEVKELNKRMFK